MLVKSSRLAELLPPDTFNILDLRNPRTLRPQKSSGVFRITQTLIKIPRWCFQEFGERFYVSAFVRGNNLWIMHTEDGLLVTPMSAHSFKICRRPGHPKIFKIGSYIPIRESLIEGIPSIKIPGAVAAGAREVGDMVTPRQSTSSGNH